MKEQTEALLKIADKPVQAKKPSSTIRIEPKIVWKHLGDDGPGGDEIEKFYESFEDNCGLAMARA